MSNREGIKDAHHVEFSHEVLIDCVALANTKGGFIRIGYKDKRVIGVKNPDNVMQETASAIKKHIFPSPLPFSIKEKEEEGKTYLKIHIQEQQIVEPYYRKEADGADKIYIRKQSYTMQADMEQFVAHRNELKEELAKMLDEKCRIAKDSPPLLKHSPNYQGTFSRLNHYCKGRGICFDSSDLKSGLTCKDGKLTRLGYLVSDTCVPQIRIYEIDPTSGKELLFEPSGPYFDQIENANTRLATYNPFSEAQSYALPYDYPQGIMAVLLNFAVMFRDYACPEKIIFKVFNDRLEFSFPAHFRTFPFVEILEFKYASPPPENNPLIDCFRSIGITEPNTTLQEIMDVYACYGITPKFSRSGNVVCGIFPNLNVSPIIIDLFTQLSAEEHAILDWIYFHYAITSGEAAKILGLSEAITIQILGSLLEKKIVEKLTPKEGEDIYFWRRKKFT